MNKQTYDAYQAKYKEAMIKESAKIGESSIVIVSEAIPPINPAAPNKVLIIVICSLAGLMMSCGFLFIKEYWEKSKDKIYAT